uniref:Nitrogen fixation protein NifU 2 n=2 Tax=Rhodobacter capsulatus TaxID=1061 RepID=NIFU2_RHOCA|nr:RecName: Full=Nitrogen fixation protein NifU 2 [Rhodobacter capsulatus]AAA08742.1 NifU2 [Rhodobacter capsulatus]CAA44879.1 nifUII [Rhodobacter capsulatus]
MKDLFDESLTLDTGSAAPGTAPGRPRRRQPAGGKAPDTAAFLANFVRIGEIAAPKPPAAADVVSEPEEEAAVVAELIAEMRPMFQRDGGDIELIGLTGATVQVRLSGSCAGCMMSARTLSTVQHQLIETLGRPVRVVPEIRH